MLREGNDTETYYLIQLMLKNKQNQAMMAAVKEEMTPCPNLNENGPHRLTGSGTT